LVASILCGLDDYFSFLLRKDISKFYLNGYRRLQGDRRHYCAVACFVARVPDAALSVLMEDGRVALRYGDLWQACCEELKWLTELPDAVWHDVAVAIGDCEGRWLRDRALQGAHLAWAFFHHRVLESASGYPWRLVRHEDGVIAAVSV
jgi:hypothetical protein